MECAGTAKQVVGTQLKFALSLCLPAGLTMDDADFTARFYIYQGRSVEIPKAEMARQDADSYLLVVDSAQLGSGGEIKCEVEVSFPDDGVAEGRRTEIITLHTGEYISHGLCKGTIGKA